MSMATDPKCRVFRLLELTPPCCRVKEARAGLSLRDTSRHNAYSVRCEGNMIQVRWLARGEIFWSGSFRLWRAVHRDGEEQVLLAWLASLWTVSEAVGMSAAPDA